MRERAEAFDGILQIASIPGKGTRVEARIPLEVQKESRL
jgi:signal transduction histidine kinase